MAVEVRMPRLTSSMVDGKIIEWLKREGDIVTQGEPLLMVESDKALTEVEACASGTLLKVVHTAGETVVVEGIVAYIGAPGEEIAGPGAGPAAPAAAVASPPASRATAAKPRRVLASPAARRLAAERGIDLSKVDGSGPDGLVLESDVLSYGEEFAAPQATHGAPYGEVTEVPLTPVQRAMSERMLASKQQVVQGTTYAEVDVTAAMEARKRMGASVTAMVAEAVVRALAEHPIMNSHLREGGLRMHGYVNLGVAVATDRGLVVPVVYNAEKLDLKGLSAAIDDRAARVRQWGLQSKEMSDATFTITNSGALGALAFVPIVSYPENAILGMGKVMEMPVVRDGAIVIRQMMYLAVSYNHRIIDGATAVTFLQRVKALLEDPAQL